MNSYICFNCKSEITISFDKVEVDKEFIKFGIIKGFIFKTLYCSHCGKNQIISEQIKDKCIR